MIIRERDNGIAVVLCGSMGELIGRLGRVTDAEFEVIEPTTEQHGTEQSAGDGTNTGSPTASGISPEHASSARDFYGF